MMPRPEPRQTGEHDDPADQDLYFRLIGVNVRIRSRESDLRSLLQANWGYMQTGPAHADIEYSVTRERESSAIEFTRSGGPVIAAEDEAEFLYEIEGDVHIALQQKLTDLYFIHAAVAEIDGKGCLLVAESGGGKSTTLWGLLHHGWRFLSDELAPIDLASMHVRAYPRALCLKQHPPAPFHLPAETVETQCTFHVPVDFLPRVSSLQECPLSIIYFVSYSPESSEPVLRSVSPGEAAARIYANTLNQLMHSNAGLDAAARISRQVPGFMLHSANLESTCQRVAEHFGQQIRAS